MSHRHVWVTTRTERTTGHPLIRRCNTCTAWQRHVRGRWVATTPGDDHTHAWEIQRFTGSPYLLCTVCGETNARPYDVHRWQLIEAARRAG